MRHSGAAGANSAALHALGIVQSGDHRLRQVALPFILPAEEAAARQLVDVLIEAAAQVRRLHHFRTGMGLAAPQLGFRRRVAVIHSPGQLPRVLLNPSLLNASACAELEFEGCLSLFDVRGRVARPTAVQVGHQDADGTPRISDFDGRLAALVAHEIDHLDGVLYPDRMAPGEDPIPVAQYRASHRSPA